MNKTYIQEKLTGNYGQVVTFDSSNNLVVDNLLYIPTSVTLYVIAPTAAYVTVTDGITTFTQYKAVGESTIPGMSIAGPITLPNIGTWTIYVRNNQSAAQSIYIGGSGTYYVTVGTFKCTLAVTYPAGAICQCSCGDLVLTATDDSGSFSFYPPITGTWEILVYKVDPVTGYVDKVTKKVIITPADAGTTINVSLSFLSSTLNDNSWELIQYAAQENIASSYWRVGDRKTITLNGELKYVGTNNTYTMKTYTNKDVDVFIIGFDHNSTLEGTGITFQFGYDNSISETDGNKYVCMYSTTSSREGASSITGFTCTMGTSHAGYWSDCELRNNICGIDKTNPENTILSLFSSDLLSVMKASTKYTYNGSSPGVSGTSDYIFLLAPYEVFSSSDVSQAYETEQDYQQRYDFYKNTTYGLLRWRDDSITSRATWGLRSSSAHTTLSAVDSTGNLAYTQIRTGTVGLSFAFLVG